MRIEPAWSPPMARSASPRASSTAHPEDEPPAERVLSKGFPTGPDAAVFESPYQQTGDHELIHHTKLLQGLTVLTRCLADNLRDMRLE